MIDKKKIVIDKLIEDNVIPKDGNFEVTAKIIDLYYDTYGKLFSSSRNKIKQNNVKYAKKMAGLNLMNLNNERSKKEIASVKVQFQKPKCGIIYLISNPAFPGMYKIGITQDLGKRLSQYQTADPLRRYKVETYKFVEDIRTEEKKYLELFEADIVKGEWVSNPKIKKMFWTESV